MKQINTLVLSLAVVVFGLASNVAYSEVSVIGQLSVDTSAVLNPGSQQQKVGSEQLPYIQGDVVSTVGFSGASIMLNSGQSSLTVAPDSVVSVDADSPLSITIQNGGISYASDQGQITLVTPAGTFDVTPDAGASFVALVEDGDFALISSNGSVLVENQSNGVVYTVDEQNAFAVTEGNVMEVVDVQLGGNGKGRLGKIIAGCAALVAGGAYYKNRSDRRKDRNASPAS